MFAKSPTICLLKTYFRLVAYFLGVSGCDFSAGNWGHLDPMNVVLCYSNKKTYLLNNIFEG